MSFWFCYVGRKWDTKPKHKLLLLLLFCCVCEGFLRWLAFWPLTNDQFKPINVQFYVNTTNVGYSTASRPICGYTMHARIRGSPHGFSRGTALSTRIVIINVVIVDCFSSSSCFILWKGILLRHNSHRRSAGVAATMVVVVITVVMRCSRWYCFCLCRDRSCVRVTSYNRDK